MLIFWISAAFLTTLTALLMLAGARRATGPINADDMASEAARRELGALDRLRAEGLESVALDLRDSASIRAAVAAVLDRTGGRLEALFNNGAYGMPGAVEDLSREALREQFEANFFGWFTIFERVNVGSSSMPISAKS